ncbi:MAG: Rieske 2Fe-2S domain-containing protein [Deltaproteobacteria bacterium]|nr:Rieske 2Fe-2S domain-containing protein [Deltaproteobacteria bacterium]
MSARGLGPIELVPPGEGRTFDLGGMAIAVFRTRDGELYATQARCPHKQGPLADGLVGGRSVTCPLHARRFDLATGQAHGGECDALRTYPVFERDGQLFVELRTESQVQACRV